MAMSMIRNKQAGLFIKPAMRKIPPKNSDVLQIQALKKGNGIFSDCNGSAKDCILFE
jgi:hypothetical protein